jgi:creatinine amidohydrolase
LLSIAVLFASTAGAQAPAGPGTLSVHWEELTGPDFRTAIARAQNTCLLPIGIM